MHRALPCLLLLLACAAPARRAPLIEADLVVYGCTSAGVAAAVQAARLGLDVVLVGPERHLGGMTSSGLGWTDSGRKEVIGGLSREFYQRIKAVYDRAEAWPWEDPADFDPQRDTRDAQWTFEPSVAERVFEDWVREAGFPVYRQQHLDREAGVTVVDGRIREIRTREGLRLRGQIFIDAGYEGDLLAAAGVSYTVGREANARYGETLNGVQPGRPHHQFRRDISPYVVPGDPSSGLLPRVSGEALAAPGSGDDKIQAYNFRVCLTRVPENRVPFPKPVGYDPAQYELLLRTVQAGSDHYRGKFDRIPNGKTDTNNSGSFSTDNIGFNHEYPEASDARRREIIEEHRRYQQGYFWFLANDPRVPAEDREWMAAWGLARDEFTDNGHWPHQIYVREARRMVSDFVVTEGHLTGRLETPRPIGMGSYNMDSHHVQRYVDADGFVRNEGDVQVSPGGPYPIDYGAIVPRAEECRNLFVLCALSASHIAYGSIRMEPVFMILGHSAAEATALALESNSSVQEVDHAALAARLEAGGQVLRWSGATSAPARAIDPATLEGIVVDDEQASYTGSWVASTSTGPYVGPGYRHDGGPQLESPPRTATFRATLPFPGDYRVRVHYPAHANRAPRAQVTVHAAAGSDTVRIDQRGYDPGTTARELGIYRFAEEAVVTLSSEEAGGYLIADAVSFVLDPEPEVTAWGTMREALRLGQTQSRQSLAFHGPPHAIGVGALTGLAGEIMILDGEFWIAEAPEPPDPAATAPRLRRAEVQDSATLLVIADVPNWASYPLPPCADLAALEAAIRTQLETLGWDRDTPVPVWIRGSAQRLEIHVIRGACPIAQPDGPAPWRWSLPSDAAGAPVDLVGIYAENAAGRWTHHTGSTHLHARSGAVMGHLDQVALQEATLLLPTRPARLLVPGPSPLEGSGGGRQ